MPISKRLVIDTDITSAASDDQSKGIEANTCRRVLETVRDLKHSFVITADLWAEWKRNRSGFAKDWLQQMHARKLVVNLGDVQNQLLQEKILGLIQGEKSKEEARKDIRLLEAAIAADKLLISKNRRDMERFIAVADRVGEIRAIVWVNPMKAEDKCFEWLTSGCPFDRERQLGYRGDNDPS